MTEQNTGIVKFARMSNQVLAGNLSQLIKDAKHHGGNAHGKLQDAMLAVKNFKTLMIDGHATTDRCGKEAAKDFMKIFLSSTTEKDKALYRALIDEGFDRAFNDLLTVPAGGSLEEQAANFVRALEEYPIQETDKNDLLSFLEEHAESTSSADASESISSSASSAGGTSAASPISKMRFSSLVASSSVPMNAGPSPTASPIKVLFESHETFKTSTQAKKLSYGWSHSDQMWVAMTTDPDVLKAIVHEGWEVLPSK